MDSNSQHIRRIEHRDLKNREVLLDTIRRCQEGDAEAMEDVYNTYKASLFKLTYRFTRDLSLSEDLLQDIFLKAFTNINKLRSPEAFNSWLYRIATNTCMSFARKKAKTKEVSLVEIGDVSGPETGDNPTRIQLERAIHTLPPKQKIVFQLHDVQGFTNSEIADTMRCSEGTIKSQLFKARIKIRKFLGGK